MSEPRPDAVDVPLSSHIDVTHLVRLALQVESHPPLWRDGLSVETGNAPTMATQ